MGAQPGDKLDAGSFVLPEHLSLGLTAAQSADRITQKFADISQEFSPLKMENLPDRVFQKNLDPLTFLEVWWKTK